MRSKARGLDVHPYFQRYLSANSMSSPTPSNGRNCSLFHDHQNRTSNNIRNLHMLGSRYSLSNRYGVHNSELNGASSADQTILARRDSRTEAATNGLQYIS